MSKVSIVVVSGERERLQMAGMMASVAAVSGDEVMVFLSMNALRYFYKDSSDSPPAEGPFGKLLEDKKAPGFKQLFKSAAELGDAKIYPCSMAVDVLGVKPQELEPWLGPPLGLTKFLSEAQGGQVLSF